MKTQRRNILVSVSGGRSSHYMARRMQLDPAYAGDNLLFCFANTGKERLETLDFVHECDQVWQMGIVWVEAEVHYGVREACSDRVVTYATASRNGEPFEAVIRKYGIPNQAFPHCTRELKLNPIHSYARRHFGGDYYVTAIGIRVDEARRIRISDDKCYPLVEWGVKVETVRRWWQQQPFDLKLRDYEGNCDLCWKKSERKLMTLVNERPGDVQWWQQMEEQHATQHLPRHDSGKNNGRNQYFGRAGMSIVELVRRAKQPFTPVTDAFWRPDPASPMDKEEPCACMLQDYEEVV